MHPLVEATLSKLCSSTGNGDFPWAESIAAVAVVVAGFTWNQTRQIEKRIREDADERSKFDLVFGDPVAMKLGLLEGILSEFNRAVSRGISLRGMAALVNTIQRQDHSEWFFGLEAFLSSHENPISRVISTDLNMYWDQASFFVDEINNATDKERARSVYRQLQACGDGFLARSRTRVVEHRMNISAPKSR